MSLTDAQIRALLNDHSKIPACARHLGFELLDFSIEERWSEVAFNPRPEFANPAGVVQGGFICAMLDDCMGFTATIAHRFTVMVPTLQMSITYLRPVPITRVMARGEVLRMGNSAVQMHATLRLPGGGQLAVATATAVPRPFPAPSAANP